MTRPLPASLRAIEAGIRPPVVWSEVTQADFEAACDQTGHSRVVVGSALADIEIGGVALDVAVEPLRLCGGYVWSLVRVEGGILAGVGYAPTLAEAKHAAESAAAEVTSGILTT